MNHWPKADREAHLERMAQLNASKQSRAQKAYRLHCLGLEHKVIAERLGISTKAVTEYIRSGGVAPPHRGGTA